MTPVSSRVYQGEQDFSILLELIARARPAAHLLDYPVKVDIEETLVSAIVHANTRLWFEVDQPVAWAYVDLFNNLRWEIDQKHEAVLGKEIVAWGESCIRRTYAGKELPTLDASCREDYSERITFLKSHGFRQTGDTTIHFMRPLSEPIPAPALPPGFIIRPILGNQEAEAVAAMHRAAFGTEYMTTESRLAIMSTKEYDPSLDLLVVTSDGKIAANCICSVNEKEKRGSTDPISVHPDFQRMGLARALLLQGLRLVHERGMTSAHLGTGGTNIGMQKAAESVGFQIEYKTIWFSKEVN